MDDYVQSCGADLIVLATRALSTRVLETSAVLGSVTLAAIKRINVPMLIINANSAVTLATGKGEYFEYFQILCTAIMEYFEYCQVLCTAIHCNTSCHSLESLTT